MNQSIEITVNGEQRTLGAGATLQDLLASLELDPRMVVVEHNRSIVRQPALAETALIEGDRVELVHFVGGG